MKSMEKKQSFEQDLVRMQSSGERRLWFSNDKITDYINRVNYLRDATKKRAEDYDFLKRYDVTVIGSVQKLLKSEQGQVSIQDSTFL